MYWLLALLSLSLAAAATTPTKPVATKGKAPVKVAAKATPAPSPAKVTPKTTVTKTPVHSSVATSTARTTTPTASRGRVQPQPQYSRYSAAANARNRRPVATSRSYARPKPAYHPAPAQPTPDRYKEIQSALASKGYLHSEPSGAWDAESTEAMKRFQKDQNLDADGKLNSLSIIALGLGPKRTLSASAVKPAQPPAAEGAPSTNPQTPAIPPRN